MDHPEPADPLDASLYRPLFGAEPMGAPPRAEQLMALDMPVEGTGEAALPAYEAQREAAGTLLETCRDLRALVRFVEAHAILEGPRGLHAGLHLLDSVVRAHWEALHPGPPDDPAAVNARRRAFAPLREPKLASWFDRLALFDAGGFERVVTIRHAWLMPESQPATRGRRPAREGEPIYDTASLAALVARAEAGPAVAAVHGALVASAAILKGLQAFFAATPDYDSLRFAALVGELEVYATILAPFASPGDAAASVAATAGGAAAATDAAPAAPPAAAAPMAGLPASRAEALALFDAVIAFYTEHSRSSPVALALVKIRRLEAASFAQWLTELDPDSPEDVRLRIGDVDLDAAEVAVAPAPDLSALTAAVAALSANEAVRAAAHAEMAALEAALGALGGPGGAAAPVIRDRAEVRQALQRLAAYYRQAEPSNPASLCFDRLIELVDRSFLDIVKRVAPTGLSSAALKLAG